MGKGDGISHNHHFVPQFHIKYFADKNGKIYGYNKLKPRDKPFSPRPKDIFADENRNTFKNSEGQNSDLIEKFYSSLESKCNAALRKLTETKILDKESKRILILFAYLSKWRSPAYDDSFEEAKKLSFEDLRLHLGDLNLGIEYDLDKIWYSEEMQAFKRILLPFQPFFYKTDYKDIFKNTFILETPEPFNAILGSCPLLENQVNSNNIFESFVFPLTPSYTLIYLNNCDMDKWVPYYEENKKMLVPLITMYRDLSIYHISRDVVISNTEERLNFIKERYEKCLKSHIDPRKLQWYLFELLLTPYKEKDTLELLKELTKS